MNLKKSAGTDEEAFSRLWEIIKILRRECPWDREQTYDSLVPCMLEEAYEAVDAVNKKDMPNLREELGDVMLQVLMNSVIAEENGDFLLISVINDECEKMIRRHPHIFSEENIKSVDKVLEKWENIKGKEKGTMTQTSVLENVPRALPALTRSYKVQKKAADVGFDWDDVSGAFQKIKEETEELLAASVSDNRNAIKDEVGDLLFSVVNAARFLKIDPEQALTGTTEKFIRRFSYVERTALKRGQVLNDMTLEEMDELWDEAKMLEKAGK
ncbi:MAG: nucleoside triphosphate pyrophosphohydrolase [Firmicutes bacterium]|nr:nucleoside triphosphate pyrophosphohydrolase [Bacillota bacterium]